jgi:alpha-tubulin suppressor-like RCC1 family protein
MNLHSLRPLAVFGLMMLVAGCTVPAPFKCTNNLDCADPTLGAGICEANGSCSFVDTTCPGSRRRVAPTLDGKAGACVPVSGCVEQITVGTGHACAVRTDGVLYCWGDNTAGQLGDGTTVQRDSPVKVTGLGLVDEVVAGEAHTCAKLQTGAVYCWGDNTARELGLTLADTDVPQSPVPVAAQLLTSTALPDGGTLLGTTPLFAKDISAGGKHTCVKGLNDTKAYCWGENQSGGHGGQCGVNPLDADDVRVATPVEGLDGVVELATGDEYTCALKDDKSIWCWGTNGQGELGNGPGPDNWVATPVNSLTSVVGVGPGDETMCVLKADSSVWCWGSNSAGILCDGTLNDHSTPVRVTTTAQLGIGGTASTACIVDAAGAMSCFGGNSKSQTGTGSTEANLLTPTPAALVTVKTVTTGNSSSCAMTLDGAVWCWGDNSLGQLGTGQAGGPQPLPVRVPVPCN